MNSIISSHPICQNLFINQPYTPTNALNLYKITDHPYTWALLHALEINRHHQGEISIKECKINISQFTNAILNIYNGRYKCKKKRGYYRNYDTDVRVTWITLSDVPLFVLCVFTCKPTSNMEIFYLKDQVPVPCIDALRVGERCVIKNIPSSQNLQHPNLILDGCTLHLVWNKS